ncbi:colicin immunity domain-containing protein [Streptomyces sp. NPDC054796]
MASGEMPPPRFAREWLAARSRAMTSGERTKAPLTSVLDGVFSCLDDYSIDPQFAEPEDLTDEELVGLVRTLLARLE